MDSLTQAALGAAVGAAFGGRDLGRKAVLWGAVLGTLPDLDLIISYDDAVANFTYHRSASHSLVMMPLVAPVLGELIVRVHRLESRARWRIWMMALMVLITHPLLDALTTYGTQLFWPLSEWPVSLASISIIDPLYTLPLIGALIALVRRPGRTWPKRLNLVVLGLTTGYLIFGIALKQVMDNRVRQHIAAQSLPNDRVLVQPTMGSLFLWTYVALVDDRYAVGVVSVLDAEEDFKPLRLKSRNLHLLAGLEGNWATRRAQWFSRGFYKMGESDNAIIISDLRVGLDPDLVLQYALAKRDAEGDARPLDYSQRVGRPLNAANIGWLFRRIGDAEAGEYPPSLDK